MAVLGKRERTSDSTQDLSISARVKRRARVPLVNDENANPNLSLSPLLHRPDDNGQSRVDSNEHRSSTPRPSISSAAGPAVGARRVALSPTKANGQSKVYQDAPTDGENIEQLPTPKTPRHRDALSKRIPITPRHRIGLVGKSLTTRTPRTPTTPSNAPTPYNCARQLFTGCADPVPLIGRESERIELHGFLEEGAKSKTGRCMYVSGPPGTGKSALVKEVCQAISSTEGVKTAYLNCMSVKSSKDVYGKLLQELVGQSLETEQDDVAHLRGLFIPNKKSHGLCYLVTLDEVDYLLKLELDILYSLFEWSLHPSSRLIVVGIANALDLTDRFLPRLKARNLKPRLLPFLPYTASEIASVITTKLKSLCLADSSIPADYVPFIHPMAIQLCSKKIASQSGDLRKAFDIVRRTLDVIEAETKLKHRSDNALKSPPDSPGRIPLSENSDYCYSQMVALTHESKLTALTAPRATIAHVSCVSAAALSNSPFQRLQTLNLQQKAVLCALIFHKKTSRADASTIFTTPSKSCAPTARQLYETYRTLCKRENALQPLTNTEFVDIISGLDTLGFVGEQGTGRGLGAPSGTPSKTWRGVREDKRLICFVDADEVKGCLEGAGRGILLSLLGCDN